MSITIEQIKQTALQSQVKQLQQLTTLATKVASQVQTLSHQLHPSTLTHLGLVAASRSLCHEVSESADIHIDFSHSDVSRSIPQEVSTCLFRVLQESLTNVVKHSGAKTVQVELAGSPSEIQLQILDSGVGFDPRSTGSRGGLGLLSMRERLNLLAAIIHKFGVSVDFLRKFRAESVFRCDYKASKLVEPNRDEARAPSGNSSARRGLYICVGAGSQGTVRWDTDGASVMRRAFVRDKTMPGAPRCDEKFTEPGHRF